MRFVFAVLAVLVGVLLVVGFMGSRLSGPAQKPPVQSWRPPEPTRPAVPVSAPAPPPDPWRYRSDKDDMGRKRSFAEVASVNAVNFEFPYAGEQHASLMLRKNHGGTNVLLIVERGQFLCDFRGCSVSVKFDDGPIVEYSASEPEDHKTTILFLEPEGRFIANLKKASVVRIEATFYQQGPRTFQFPVKGLDWE